MAGTTSPAGFVVAPADLDRDLGTIEDVINRNPSAAAVPVSARRLAWLFRENPAGTGHAWVLTTGDDSRPVGTGSLIPRRMIVAGATVLSARASLLAVDPACRALGPAVMIERQVCGRAESEGMPVVFAVAPPATIPVFKRCGYVRIGDYVRYGKPLRVEPHLRRLTGLGTGLRWLAAPANAALRAVSRETWIGHGNARVEEVSRVDARFDDLWTRAAASYGYTTARSSAYLAWRFSRYPGDEGFTILGLVSRDGRLQGYAVYFLEGGHAHVYDLCAATLGDDMDRLLGAVIRRARAARANTVSFLMGGDSRFERILERFGFRRRQDADEPAALLLWCHDPATLARIQREGWYILPADNV